MALINIKFFSNVLGRNVNFDVIIPQKATTGQIGIENNAKEEKYKTLLLLHGLSDDGTIWARRTSIERYASAYGIAVIMPSGDRSFYTDMKYGDKYFTYISEEIVNIAREFLPLSDKREDTFVCGNSMGGYGALKIALKKPDKFGAAAGLSSVADVRGFMEKHAPHLKYSIFGEEVPDCEDLHYLAKECNKNTVKPRIYMALGFDDYMYKENVALKATFDKLNFDYTYVEGEGTHNWAFWDTYIQKVLQWLFNK